MTSASNTGGVPDERPSSRHPVAGRRAVVTGAGSGIGRAIALELAARGSSVCVTDVDAAAAEKVAREIDESGGRAVAARCDVRESRSIAAAADEAEESFGAIDTWVSNAGISTMRRFRDITRAEWDDVLAVNTTGVFLCGQEAARRIAGPGAIVNVASMAGKQGRVPFLAHYVASKFAVVGLTQAMAFELADRQIRVNAVCPGYVASPMQERELEWEAELRGIDTSAVQSLMIADTPLGRLETPKDVARVVAFLCGDDSSFLTGESIAVNGGAFMD